MLHVGLGEPGKNNTLMGGWQMVSALKRTIAAAVLAAVVGGAQAQERPWYFNVNVWQFDEEGFDELGGLAFDVGRNLTRWLSVQARVGATESDDDFQVDYTVGAHARVDVRYDNFSLYALAGYSYFKFSGDLAEFADYTSDDGPSLGLGMALYGSPNTAFTLEYMRHFLRDADGDADTLHLGILHHFGWQRPTNW